MLMNACSQAENPGPTHPTTVSAAANVSDVDITTHVKSALNSEPDLAGLDITVVTTKGDIRLMGVVPSQVQIDTAVRAARASEGAHTIHNELTVQQ